MANPNIVSVSSIYAGNAAWALTTTITTTLWTVGADVVVKINTMMCTNVAATTTGVLTVDIDGIGTTVTGVTGSSLATVCELANAVSVPAKETYVVIDSPIYLMENDVLRGGSTGTTMDLLISYEVINDA